ncbi:xylitol oxidase [Sanguibacter gelidistatuariae]|uniref:Xylitol oxidase n=1 Tax=Sanguibacter gelidistatuariae TaxID=1814289 RepID=A0A1G6HAJ4_9MICO|nr:D-arabinono-1,4-lactone oxidase [Sanguibacter gelidistatuariae]SDB91173.1 xylitol oxidase [Sanguibacter gelidistatuariae]
MTTDVTTKSAGTHAATLAGTNWAGNLSYSAHGVVRPTTVAEVRDLVLAAGAAMADAASGAPAGTARLRALGSRHCFNDLADTSGLLVSLEDLEPVAAGHLQLGTTAAGIPTVRVSAGTRYGDLAAALFPLGLAVHNLASLPHISIAGAIATATHGSGNGNQGLGGAVVGLELVTGTGEFLTLRRDEEGPVPFDAAVVHLGALGIITHITLAVEPTFDVRQDVYQDLPWASLEQNFDAITGAAYSVSVFTRLREDAADQVWLKSRVDALGETGDLGYGDDFFGARRAAVALHPLPGISAENCSEQLGVPGPGHERLAHFRREFTPSNGAELQSEYLVPREHAVAAIAAVRALRERIVPLLQIIEFRTMAADGLWLSPAGQHDTVGLHFTWLPRQTEVEALLPAIEAALAPFDARPHWGKLFTTDAARLAELFPRLGEFAALADGLDPAGVFANDYLDRVLGR